MPSRSLADLIGTLVQSIEMDVIELKQCYLLQQSSLVLTSPDRAERLPRLPVVLGCVAGLDALGQPGLKSVNAEMGV